MKVSVDGIIGSAERIKTQKKLDEENSNDKKKQIKGDSVSIEKRIDTRLNRIEKDFKEWPGSQFLSIETTGSTCVLVINRKHPFFSDLYEPLLDAGDDKYIEALDLTLMSYARMEDELYSRVDDLDEMRDIWGRYLKSFLLELRSEA